MRPAGQPRPVQRSTTLHGISPEDDDHVLVEAAQAGDTAALDSLLRRHQGRIYAICRRMTGNDADALDASQEALIALVRGLHHFDGRAAFTTWSYRVATNACLDELRRRKRRPDPSDPDVEVAEIGGPPPLDDTIASRLELDAALADLPADYRSAVVLRDQLGLDYAEIAEVLGIPAGTVRSRIARGRGALATALTTGPGTRSPSERGNQTRQPNVPRDTHD